MRKPTKVTAAIASGALVVATAGVAYAYWTTEGSGTGGATVAGNYAELLEITSTAPAAALLVPGSDHTIDVTVVNPNEGDAFVNTVSGVVTVVNDDELADCTAADFGVASIEDFGQVPPGATGVTKSTTLTFTSTDVSQDDCKNAVLSIAWSNDTDA